MSVHMSFSVSKLPMQKATTNFVFGILVGLVFTFLGFAYMTGTSFQRTLRMPVKSDRVGHVEGTQQPVVKSVLTHEDLEKIQQIIKPVQFRDEGHHHGMVGLGTKKVWCVYCNPTDPL